MMNTGKSRESRWVDQYRETHYTSVDIARKYSIEKSTVRKRMYPPDIVAPFKNRTGLWEKEKTIKHLGEPPK
jgi:hypothetical protein